MNFGPLSKRITVEVRSSTKDSFGGLSPTWTTLGVYWCEIRTMTGRALEAAQALHSEVTHEIRLRYTPAISAKHRGKYAGRVFEFKAVFDVDEQHVETRILASEGLTQG